MVRAFAATLIILALTAGSVFAEVEEVERYASLVAITRQADAIIVGRVVQAVPGRVFSGCGYTAATVEVERVLGGQLRSTVPEHLTLEYFGWCLATLPQLGTEIPAERAVFFLRNKGAERNRLDARATASEIRYESAFWRLVILAGTVVDRDGTVHVPETLNAPFLAELEGTSFDRFVDRVRSAAAGAPDTSTSPQRHPDATMAPLIPIVVGLAALAWIARDRNRTRWQGVP